MFESSLSLDDDEEELKKNECTFFGINSIKFTYSLFLYWGYISFYIDGILKHRSLFEISFFGL